MNIEQRRLLSLLLSAATATRSNPCSTQAPTSIKDSLRSYGISEEDKNKWKNKYNHTSLRLIRDNLFSKLLTDIACDTYPTTVEFKSKLKSVIEQKSTDSRNEFNDQVCTIMLDGAAIFKESQRLEFLLVLDNKHAVYYL
jgi:hypothetical protein